MGKWRGGEWCGMAERRSIPADLRGKEEAIPAGYVDENTGTAGKAGIASNGNAWGKLFLCRPRERCVYAHSDGLGAIPAIPADSLVSITYAAGIGFAVPCNTTAADATRANVGATGANVPQRHAWPQCRWQIRTSGSWFEAILGRWNHCMI